MAKIRKEELERFEKKLKLVNYIFVQFGYRDFSETYGKKRINILKKEDIFIEKIINLPIEERMKKVEKVIEVFGIEIGVFNLGDKRVLQLLKSPDILYYILLNFVHGFKVYMNIGIGKRNGQETLFVNFCNDDWLTSWKKDLKTIFRDTNVQRSRITGFNGKRVDIERYSKDNDEIGSYMLPLCINHNFGKKIQEKAAEIIKLLDFANGKDVLQGTSPVFHTPELRKYNETMSSYDYEEINIKDIQEELQNNEIVLSKEDIERLVKSAEKLIDNIL